MTNTEIFMTVLGWIGGAVTSGIGKVIVGALGALGIAWVNTRLGIWRDERADKRKREGQLAYSVALLVSALRQYMLACMSVMTDNGEPDRQQGEYADWVTTVPRPKFTYSDKIDWTLLDQKLMFEILSLSTVEAGQEECVSSAYEHSYPPDRHGWIEERQLRYAELAEIAASHLVEIHKQHPMKFTAEPTESIREITLTLVRLEEARKKEQEDNAFWLAEMHKKHPPKPPGGVEPVIGVIEEPEEPAK
ncbi:hypothetical protein G6K88_14120 [Agrobacterium rhizogenes]|uniref:hypothetical protein n=1 Tax=Rhizobium rhizogenes TaxID=359 RepID=UPI00115D2198|nr:hypothetical protein [Rhizobium rhizogenes]NTI03156.1 hypothetical protein [Rhizobium rhizogenes]NTI09960.1 hypothetical protein [Rhizobium rhizogenes]TRB21516.1 hypothetical protein EXN70_21655 [Rhizobium rhizogenes]